MATDVRSKRFVVVINRPFDYEDENGNKKEGYIPFDVDSLSSMLNVLYSFYACILHDSDINADTGELKTEHFHIVLERQSLARYTTIINELSKWTGFPSNCISVDYCQLLNKSIRYLTHIDDEDKYQYSDLDVRTNRQEYVDNALKHLIDFIDFDYIASIVYQYEELPLIIKHLGIDIYNKYWRVVNSLLEKNDDKYDTHRYAFLRKGIKKE